MVRLVLTFSDNDISLLMASLQGVRRFRVPLPSGLIQGGKVTDKDKFTQLLKQSLVPRLPKKEAHFEAIIALPEEYAFIKTIDVPKTIKRREIINALAFQWQSILPVAMDKVYFTYVALKKAVKKETQNSYLIIAYPRETIDIISHSLMQLKITPVRFIPLSFGYAELYQPKTIAPVLVVSSENGKQTLVAVVANGLTRFSTTIHAGLGTPTVTKQLENIKRFYDQTIKDPKDNLTKIIINRSRYTDTLRKHVAVFKFPTEVIQADQTLWGKKKLPTEQEFEAAASSLTITKANQTLKIKGAGSFAYEQDAYVPLFGLLQSKAVVTILPPELLDLRRYAQQSRVVLLNCGLSLLITLVGIGGIYLFQHQVQLEKTPPSQFTEEEARQISHEEEALSKHILDNNALADSVAQDLAKRTNIADLIDHTYTAAKNTPGITITSVAYASQKKVITITGTRQSRQSLLQFADQLKTQQVGSIAPSLASLQAENDAPFQFEVPH